MRKRGKAKPPAGERAVLTAEKPPEEIADLSTVRAEVAAELKAELKAELGQRYFRLGRAGLAKIKRKRGHPRRDPLVDATRFFAVKEQEATPHRRGDGDKYTRAFTELSRMDPLLFCGLRVLPAEPNTIRTSCTKIEGSAWAAEYADLEDLLGEFPRLLSTEIPIEMYSKCSFAELIPMMDRQVGPYLEQSNRLTERMLAKYRAKQALRSKTAS